MPNSSTKECEILPIVFSRFAKMWSPDCILSLPMGGLGVDLCMRYQRHVLVVLLLILEVAFSRASRGSL